MKPYWIIALLIGHTVVIAGAQGEPQGPPSAARFAPAPRAWLGLEVTKPDETITAHLPDLPAGIGFIIRSIHKGGPAELAGLREFDVLWKLGDQMLVNEGQLAALLRLCKPSDEIVLHGFRAGKAIEVTLKPGETPPSLVPFPPGLVDAAVFPSDYRPNTSVILHAERLAKYTTQEGCAQIQKDGDIYRVKILSPSDETIYEGDLPADGNIDAIPADWKIRIQALRRGLDHALDGRMMPARQPRPRVVPPSVPNKVAPPSVTKP
jgi:hypothetical protein